MTLSMDGLALYRHIPHINDFTFIIDTHKYHCSKILAAFISPAVARSISSDIFCDVFHIPIDDNNFIFKQVMRLMRGEEIEITSKNYQYLLNVASILENQEIINKINSLSIFKFDEQTILNSTMKKLERNMNIDNEIDFIAASVTSFPARSLAEFDIPTLWRIFSSSCLKAKEESSIFQLICDLIELKGYQAKVLLNCVYYENLSLSEMVDFGEMINDYQLTGPIMMSLIKRLQKIVKQHKRNPLRKISNEESYEFKEGKSFDGIFAHLQKQWNKNVQDQKICKITTSSGDSPKGITDNTWNDCWYSKNEPNSWIRFDFLDHAVSLTHYSLKTFIGGPHSGHLKSWSLEGSNDGKIWKVMDQRDNTEDLNNRNNYYTYKCDDHGIYRYVRLKQTGKNHRGNDFLFLSNIEFFGAFI
ncbi:hypothetical protein TRFO_15925 [Tritrichomonas foetus]|uniref:Uncharacterized protein n=1 Tax=Tritrichomonas foetus TaxID=1144522 RepID=A0A1J4KRD1_9EUKA|nr:hypothetical protein TRFO_15925 [Tritrichomonas foetus]|eukprot:OHT13811.1 hypothetical protein TRFO_15925 [Tritrichomonas foetus]